MQNGKHIADRIAAMENHRQIQLFCKRELLAQDALLGGFVVAFKVIIKADFADCFYGRMLCEGTQRIEVIRGRERAFWVDAAGGDDQLRVPLCECNGCGRIFKLRPADHAADDAFLREAAEWLSNMTKFSDMKYCSFDRFTACSRKIEKKCIHFFREYAIL